MTTILTINAGSSSLKFSVWENVQVRWRGQIEQIGGHARLTVGRTTTAVVAPTLVSAMIVLRKVLTTHRVKPSIVAHRIVHGGEWYNRPTRINNIALSRLASITHLAPLHLPINLAAVRFGQRTWPNSQAWGVFDTAPYHGLPSIARTYALPAAITKKFGIRKYGFHGTSHYWALTQAAKKLKRPIRTTNAITLHLGAGSSVTQWRNGRVVDTSMGFTPLAGVVMMTRTGDIDPSIPLYLQTHGRWSASQVDTMLNKQSGLVGLTGLNDMRDVLQAAGHPVPTWPRRSWTVLQRQRARLGLDLYVYSLQRYLSSYIGLTPHLNAIIFTGMIGQNRKVQRLILAGVQRPRQTSVITIPTDEERAIAEAVQRVVK